jgi:hypothetical protein
MKQDRRKPGTRPVGRPHPGLLLAALDGMGESLVEGIVGLWLGLALTALVAWGASADFQNSLSGAALRGTPDHLCAPRIGGGPYLDGDRVTLANGDSLICDGVTGGWQSPAARAARGADIDAALSLLY